MIKNLYTDVKSTKSTANSATSYQFLVFKKLSSDVI